MAFFSNLLGITFGGGEAPGNTTERDNSTDTVTHNPTFEHMPLPQNRIMMVMQLNLWASNQKQSISNIETVLKVQFLDMNEL